MSGGEIIGAFGEGDAARLTEHRATAGLGS